MSGPYYCTDAVESCKECSRYMDDCDGMGDDEDG